MTKSALVSCEWLRLNLEVKNQVILDATFFLPRQQRNALEEYQHHIPGSLFFDIDEIADRSNSLPHTLPSVKQFSEAIGKMGIDHHTSVIIYDNNHFFAAARAWWIFRVFGHKSVKILDGGLKRWRKLNLPIESEKRSPISKIYKTRYRPELIYDLKKMMHIHKLGSRQIIDARSNDSFRGQRPLTASNLQPGHIPNSINLAYAGLTDAKQETLLSVQQLKLLFSNY